MQRCGSADARPPVAELCSRQGHGWARRAAARLRDDGRRRACEPDVGADCQGADVSSATASVTFTTPGQPTTTPTPAPAPPAQSPPPIPASDPPLPAPRRSSGLSSLFPVVSPAPPSPRPSPAPSLAETPSGISAGRPVTRILVLVALAGLVAGWALPRRSRVRPRPAAKADPPPAPVPGSLSRRAGRASIIVALVIVAIATTRQSGDRRPISGPGR